MDSFFEMYYHYPEESIDPVNDVSDNSYVNYSIFMMSLMYLFYIIFDAPKKIRYYRNVSIQTDENYTKTEQLREDLLERDADIKELEMCVRDMLDNNYPQMTGL